MNLGDAAILEYVLASRPSLTPHTALIRDSIAGRRRDALDSAFVDGDFAAVRAIYSGLPAAARSFQTGLKRFVAALPAPLASGLVRMLSSARTALR